MAAVEFERETIAAFDDAGGVQRRPGVVMLMPHQPTEVQFFGQLLGALHAPVAGHFIPWFSAAGSGRAPVARARHARRCHRRTQLSAGGHPASAACLLQLLRFLSNELRLAFVGVGVPEHATPCFPTVSCGAASQISNYRHGP